MFGAVNRVRPSIPLRDVMEVRLNPNVKGDDYLATVKTWGGEKLPLRGRVYDDLLGSDAFQVEGWRLVNGRVPETIPPTVVDIRWGFVRALLMVALVLGCALMFVE